MATELRTLGPADLVDTDDAWPVTDRQVRHDGAIFATVTERIRTPDEGEITRDWVAHDGAVGVIALDEDDRVVLIRQYRHPVRSRLWEPPAGLLDVDGEPYVTAAARELAEEAGLAATDWHELVEVMTSPGMTSERVRIFLARGLSPAPAPDGFRAEGEEAHLEVGRAALDDVVTAVLGGRVHNPLLVSGALAASTARARGWTDLRPATDASPVSGRTPARSSSEVEAGPRGGRPSSEVDAGPRGGRRSSEVGTDRPDPGRPRS